jgi:hypothetical protein
MVFFCLRITIIKGNLEQFYFYFQQIFLFESLLKILNNYNIILLHLGLIKIEPVNLQSMLY